VYCLHWVLSTIFLSVVSLSRSAVLSGGLLSKDIKCLRGFYRLPCSSQSGLRLPVLKSISPIISRSRILGLSASGVQRRPSWAPFVTSIMAHGITRTVPNLHAVDVLLKPQGAPASVGLFRMNDTEVRNGLPVQSPCPGYLRSQSDLDKRVVRYPLEFYTDNNF